MKKIDSPEVNQRFLRAVEMTGLSTEEFAQKMGWNKYSLYNMRSKGNIPDGNTLVKFKAVFPSVNLNWVFTGIGSPTVREHETFYDRLVDTLKGGGNINVSDDYVASKFGLTDKDVSNMRTYGYVPDAQFVEAVAKEFNISGYWLSTGQPDPPKASPQQSHTKITIERSELEGFIREISALKLLCIQNGIDTTQVRMI